MKNSNDTTLNRTSELVAQYLNYCATAVPHNAALHKNFPLKLKLFILSLRIRCSSNPLNTEDKTLNLSSSIHYILDPRDGSSTFFPNLCYHSAAPQVIDTQTTAIWTFSSVNIRKRRFTAQFYSSIRCSSLIFGIASYKNFPSHSSTVIPLMEQNF
jgi:hypothetical protein